MDNGIAELIHNMFCVLPIIKKKLVYYEQTDGYTHPYLMLLALIIRENGKPMNYYSDKMMVSRPNLTVLSNRLCKDGLIERKENANDRRIVSLYLTPKGMEKGCLIWENIINAIVNRLKKLNGDDLKELNESMNSIAKILNKLSD